jgi:hypothetical protein
MRDALAAGALALAGVLVELLLPGHALYHDGWYNVLLTAFALFVILRLRNILVGLTSRLKRLGVLLAAFGMASVVFAGVAQGLFAPSTHTVIGAPGEAVHVDELDAALVFPLVDQARRGESVLLERASQATAIGTQRYTESFLLRALPRQVVDVTVTDPHGAHLTMTQPTGAAFLSPVLLMQSQQRIAGMLLPFDTFAVPAARRSVKVVLFSSEQAAQFPALAHAAGPAVLFDVETGDGHEIPGAIGVARNAGSVTLGGLVLRPQVLAYPEIEIIAIPDLAVVGFGMVAVLLGLLLTREPSTR